jgi:hypothetical protein
MQMTWFTGGVIGAAMKIRVAGLILGLLAGPAVRAAAAEAPPLAHSAIGVPNGCFVETVALLDDFADAAGASAWARMLQWGATEQDEVVAGHAVAVVESRGKLWCWDVNFGWSALAVPTGRREEAEVVAAPLTARYPTISPKWPSYRFDFPQTPAASAKPPGVAAEGPAKTVAARLAKHRPVNLVEFSYMENGAPRKGQAVVFNFHGRFCIYAPEKGTVPFLPGPGGILAIPRISNALRRMYTGGVTDVKSVAW